MAVEPDAPMIELSGVSKRYGGRAALHAMDLKIGLGRTTVLIGPSGCGKSTTLRLIIGLIDADAGHVSVDGVTIDERNIIEIRRRMGYVIQGGGLFPHLTARENATLMARYLEWTQDRIDERLDSLVSLTHFPKDGLDRYPTQLSGGQRQRVSLMRALMLDPGVLLLDEPLGALDPMIRAELQDELRSIFSSLGTTVVMVTHDLGEAAVLGDEIVLMREGCIVQRGALPDLIERPADEFVTRFVNAQRHPLAVLEADR